MTSKTKSNHIRNPNSVIWKVSLQTAFFLHDLLTFPEIKVAFGDKINFEDWKLKVGETRAIPIKNMDNFSDGYMTLETKRTQNGHEIIIDFFSS